MITMITDYFLAYYIIIFQGINIKQKGFLITTCACIDTINSNVRLGFLLVDITLRNHCCESDQKTIPSERCVC
ncbi:hypothetical protein L2E82_34531 [Cichorium intybus]|uniref:Uncharacterized protein n=1 Tax=Cichorium intybus TaxID=13427 RepID=A0ACB9BMD4_CICIN|nr:hypothetical protein L2E82_34531 [Cichorium intybus]